MLTDIAHVTNEGYNNRDLIVIQVSVVFFVILVASTRGYKLLFFLILHKHFKKIMFVTCVTSWEWVHWHWGLHYANITSVHGAAKQYQVWW